MKILIEFYDRSTLKNLVAALGICPDIIKYFYDPNVFPYREIYSTYSACKKYIPNLSYEVGMINSHDYENITEALTSYIQNFNGDEIFIDLTGGSELTVIAAYDAAMHSGCHVYFTDISKNSIINLRTKKEQYRSMPFDIEDMIDASGGRLIGCTDSGFLKDNRSSLYNMAYYILNHNTNWLKTCQYFQKHNVRLRQNKTLHFRAPREQHKNDPKTLPDMDFLYELSHQRLITHLSENTKEISFDYKNSTIIDNVSSFGVWLELYTYYQVIDISQLHDVHTSIKIDWNAHDQIEIIGNEIDVTAMYGCRPVIISCKQSKSPIGAEVLNELYVVSRRIGGKYAIPILVTMSSMKTKHLGIYLKAKEMGIHMLDVHDILSDNYKTKLKRIITGQDN
ncbi:MAG: DUF1887 family CARF protein [Clostridiales bacterium]|nr:DUF1887 family CARF protein [Clostridiales bacterium]MDY3746869.1 DUF1887 family CARF protein [Lachnospiraceae bacterium]